MWFAEQRKTRGISFAQIARCASLSTQYAIRYAWDGKWCLLALIVRSFEPVTLTLSFLFPGCKMIKYCKERTEGGGGETVPLKENNSVRRWWQNPPGGSGRRYYMASFETVSSTVLEKVAEGHTEKLVEVIVCALTRGTFAENQPLCLHPWTLLFFFPPLLNSSASFSTFHPLWRRQSAEMDQTLTENSVCSFKPVASSPQTSVHHWKSTDLKVQCVRYGLTFSSHI